MCVNSLKALCTLSLVCRCVKKKEYSCEKIRKSKRWLYRIDSWFATMGNRGLSTVNLFLYVRWKELKPKTLKRQRAERLYKYWSQFSFDFGRMKRKQAKKNIKYLKNACQLINFWKRTGKFRGGSWAETAECWNERKILVSIVREKERKKASPTSLFSASETTRNSANKRSGICFCFRLCSWSICWNTRLDSSWNIRRCIVENA